MIELHHIHFRYTRKKKIFDGLNLTLAPGHIYGLLGKNGAGKSTLLKMMAGLLFPQKGEGLAFNHPMKDRAPSFLENMFLIPEEFDLPSVSLEKFTRYNSAFYPKFNKDQLGTYLREFEIPAESKLSSMSYGQKKKFLLAFGLASNTRLLIMDEPTNGLDIPSKSQFRKIIASAMTEEKIFVISTHQVRDLENLIEAVVILEQGQIIFNQNIQTISDKLFFDDDLRHASPDQVLYSGEAGNNTGIRINTSGADSRVDLEILFNAVMINSHGINQYFN
jgi:ABC-2 type transport system ATP-binding protein